MVILPPSQVNIFGESGKCQSLSALLEHGYAVWRRHLRDDTIAAQGSRAEGPPSLRLEAIYEEADRAYLSEDFRTSYDLCSELLRSRKSFSIEIPNVSVCYFLGVIPTFFFGKMKSCPHFLEIVGLRGAWVIGCCEG